MDEVLDRLGRLELLLTSVLLPPPGQAPFPSASAVASPVRQVSVGAAAFPGSGVPAVVAHGILVPEAEAVNPGMGERQPSASPVTVSAASPQDTGLELLEAGDGGVLESQDCSSSVGASVGASSHNNNSARSSSSVGTSVAVSSTAPGAPAARRQHPASADPMPHTQTRDVHAALPPDVPLPGTGVGMGEEIPAVLEERRKGVWRAQSSEYSEDVSLSSSTVM